MPDKKLSDSEIVKAFEIFVNSVGKGFVFANVDIKKDEINEFKHIDLSYDEIFDLINRLQAENERKDKIYIELLKTSSERAGIIGEQNAEIERLKNTLDDVLDREPLLVERSEKYAKAEAYKECIEKVEERIAVHLLRDKSNEYAEGFADALDGVNGELDNLLKELTENN